jgi:short-subunit dehydrogenase
VEGFTESLHYELEPLNIRLKLIEPGIIETEFAGRSRETVKPEYTTDYNPYLQKFEDAFAKAGKQGGEKPSVVAQAIVKAACDKGNKLRYPIGKPAPALLMLRKLPDRWFFSLLKRSLKM